MLDRIYFQYSGAMSAADLATVLSTTSAAWNTNLSPIQSTDAQLNGILGTDLTTTSSPQVLNGTVRAGQAGTAPLAADSAAVVKFKIARRYRGGHPRFYFGGIIASELANAQTWLTLFQNNLATDFAAFIAAAVLAPPAAVGTLTHVNVSYFQGFSVVINPITHRARNVPNLRLVAGVPTPTVDAVIGYSVNPNVASQRRRALQSP